MKHTFKSFAPASFTSWRNWWPAGEERRFKRQTGYWLPPYVAPEAVPPLRYPQTLK